MGGLTPKDGENEDTGQVASATAPMTCYTALRTKVPMIPN
jgi:hypothetical protein